jgi:ubiquinone/menaquinone biosynthesis C-methylase UbiE
VDLSGKMVELAARRASNLGAAFRNRVQFHNCDIRDFSHAPNAPYDLLTAHFFFDCFTDADLFSVMNVIRRFSAPAAQCIVSEFREIPSSPGRQISRAVIHSLYAAFRVATRLRTTRLPDHAQALRAHGFQLQRESFLLHGLLHSSLWKFQPEPDAILAKPSAAGNAVQSFSLPR